MNSINQSLDWFICFMLGSYLNTMRVLLYILSICFVIGSSAQKFNSKIEIPEPIMFDLVRGLGAHQGELEVNTLADPPLNYLLERHNGHLK